ncbi:MAG TPA: glycosyl hydrolase family 28-related protein [Sediminibacterium sp.]|nr:glycosyl hydrolase family 28-related protein [Sediminibacterium sp.]
MKRQYLILFIAFWGCRKSPPPIPEPDVYFPRVNVKDFGAVGNGLADDTHAFDLAMDKANVLKLPVYVPVGIYKARVQLSHDSLRIVGQRQPGADVGSGAIVLGLIDCNYKKYVSVENIGIDSRGQLLATDDAALTSGVYTNSLVLHQQFKNISIIGDGYKTFKHGMLCSAGSDIIIRNVTVSLFYHGIAIRCSNVSVDSVYAYNCGFTSIVVKSDRGDNILTENVSINHVFTKGDPNDAYNRAGAVMVTSYADPASITRNVTIQNVHSANGGVACVLVYQNNGLVDNVSIKDCTAEGQGDSNTRACYDVDGGSDITFTNCTATNSKGYGFRSVGAVNNIKVINGFERNSGAGSWKGTYKYLQLNGVEVIK